MFSRIKYQKKSVYLKSIFINIQGKIELLQEKEIDSMAKKGKGMVKATLCFLHRKTLGFGQLALYHCSILTELT